MTLGEHIRALREGRGWTLEELSARSNVDVGTISALENRKSRRSQYAAALAHALGVSLDELVAPFVLPPKGGTPAQGVKEPEPASQWVQKPRIVKPQFISWRDVVAGTDLGDLFVTTMPDDANAPEFPKGLDVIWSTSKPPQIGSLVLVRDGHGQVHARRFHQGRTPDQWLAVPLNLAFTTLDSAVDDLQVLAVAAFKALP